MGVIVDFGPYGPLWGRLGVVTAISAASALAGQSSLAANLERAQVKRPKRLVFADEFKDLDVGPGRKWGWKSGAYKTCVTNRNNYKLDHLSRDALSVEREALRITSKPSLFGGVVTGLITTGDSCSSGGSGFMVRTGDFVHARVRLPTGTAGAWPGIWTWRDGGNEIDLFEWHSHRPNTLEFVNHVRSSFHYWKSPEIRPGRWFEVAVRLGARGLTWYVGSERRALRPVFSDRRGVGARFRAYLVANLSIDDGKRHPRPANWRPLVFEIDSIKVYR